MIMIKNKRFFNQYSETNKRAFSPVLGCCGNILISTTSTSEDIRNILTIISILQQILFKI